MKNGLFCDGGCVRVNPSPIAGTWAWCLVEDDVRVKEGSGLVLPTMITFATVSNNITELWAVVEALEAMPDGWEGTVYTDSLVTIRRVAETTRKPPAATPAWLMDRMRKAKAGKVFSMTLLGGHPTKAELAAGHRRDGLPCSPHNVWCDARCGVVGSNYLQSTDLAKIDLMKMRGELKHGG